MRNRTRLIIIFVFGLVTVVSLILFLISKASAGTQSDIFLWGIVIMAAATFLAALKDIIELVERFWPNKGMETKDEMDTAPVDPMTEALMFEPDPDSPYYSCFISYSTKDEDFARQIYADLRAAGVACWYAPEDMKIGDKIRDTLHKAVWVRSKLLLILSDHSVQSGWVEEEVEAAFEKERETGTLMLFPVLLDDTVMDLKVGWAAHIKRTRHFGDFRQQEEYEQQLKRLLRDLEKRN